MCRATPKIISTGSAVRLVPTQPAVPSPSSARRIRAGSTKSRSSSNGTFAKPIFPQLWARARNMRRPKTGDAAGGAVAAVRVPVMAGGAGIVGTTATGRGAMLRQQRPHPTANRKCSETRRKVRRNRRNHWITNMLRDEAKVIGERATGSGVIAEAAAIVGTTNRLPNRPPANRQVKRIPLLHTCSRGILFESVCNGAPSCRFRIRNPL